jgi:hypothetical protein
MKPTTRRCLIAIGVVLLFVTTAEVIAVYRTPPSYLSEARMMLRGEPLRPLSPAEPHPVYLILLLVAVYTPGLLLLLAGMFFRRGTRNEITHSI